LLVAFPLRPKVSRVDTDVAQSAVHRFQKQAELREDEFDTEVSYVL
jgi:hypothetical protein